MPSRACAGGCGGTVTVKDDVCHVMKLSHTTVSTVLKLFSAFKQPTFTTLELSDGELDQFSLEKLTQTFLPMHTFTITTLKLSRCPLPEGVVTVLVRCFKETGSLRRLVLDTCRDVSMTALMTLTSLLPPIEHLELPSCKLPRQAGLILGQTLQLCSRLRTLILRQNNLGDGGARAIADAFQPKKCHVHGRHRISKGSGTGIWVLDTLDLSGNGISNVGFSYVLAISVRELLVSYNNITSIHDVTGHVPLHLKSLDLSYNPISTDGFHSVGALISGTCAQANLTSLNIENCCITVDGLCSLRDAITRNPATKLREIRLGEDNSIHDPATRVGLAELLECMSRVTPHVECIISPTIVPKPTSPTQQLDPVGSSSMLRPMNCHAIIAKGEVNRCNEMDHQDNDRDSFSMALNSPQSSSARTHSIHDEAEFQDDCPSPTAAEAIAPSEMAFPHDDPMRREAMASMNMAFEAHNMTHQHRAQSDSVVHRLCIKVETLESLVPRLEGQLDRVAERVAGLGAQLPSMQADVATQLGILRHDLLSRMSSMSGDEHDRPNRGALSLLGSDDNHQTGVDPSIRAPWKAKMEARQQELFQQFQRWQVYMETDRMQLTNRVQELEAKVAGLENVVKAEQQASLLALEAISSAFVSD
ncbi:hypothetical protein H310_13185 [Aphanomyces invadans]|uniref:Uncharacterized protein n=1 Tax=Aphanomyces invadans TaxID=157072 RepID=A0A024TEC1_9STRA|nr:hypothetical protein H310_13185 [Aphanomyces invadans]ETV92500.1 hypothetical protein H310_13185 [Aphanomyces invadans]|eukprot:XP_008878807.1 hypothetical protein H310_13185 [Aphanomyces invadans]